MTNDNRCYYLPAQANLARYIADEIRAKEGREEDVDTWSWTSPKAIPHQGNCSDCGPFMLTYIEFKVSFKIPS